MPVSPRRLAGDWTPGRGRPAIGSCRLPGRHGIRSVLCRFLDRCLPQRAMVAEDWARRAAFAPWTGIYLSDDDSRQRIGVATEMRIGLDLVDTPGYSDLLSFLPPDEYSALLSAAGFSSDESPTAGSETTDPLLLDWRRVHQPIGYDEHQQAALAACLEAAGKRNVQFSFLDRPVQARRYVLNQTRSIFAEARSERAGDVNSGADIRHAGLPGTSSATETGHSLKPGAAYQGRP